MPKILVADDNSNIQKMVANALKDQGIEVVGFSNGHTAMKKFPDVAPDMVLADVFMPVSDGYELCDWIKKSEKFSAVPVFLLVGAFDPLDEQRLAAVKADGVLKKPFVPPDNLIAAVKAMLERVTQAKHAEMMERTHHDFASQVPHVEETQKLSQEEMRELLGEKPAAAPPPPPPPPEPEPEMHEYTAKTPQIQLGESSAPAFADMLGDAGDVVEQPSFQASSTAEAQSPVPSYDIKEASKTPDPDLPPIKVDFSGPSEPMELVTDDRHAPGPTMEPSRLEELVSSTHDWTPPPPPPAAPTPEPPVLQAQMPPMPTISVEPEPPPPTSAPLGIPSKDLPGLEWSRPAAAAPAAAAAPPPPAAAPAPAVTIPVAAPVNPYVVDEVVDKIMMKLQPQIIHRITTEVGKALEALQPKVLEQVQRDVVRPLAEELLRDSAKK